MCFHFSNGLFANVLYIKEELNTKIPSVAFFTEANIKSLELLRLNLTCSIKEDQAIKRETLRLNLVGLPVIFTPTSRRRY